MDKKEWLEILKARYADFEVSYIKQKIPRWGSWKKVTQLSPEQIEEVNLRQVFEDEIVIDLEDPNLLQNVEKLLQQENYSYTVWKTGSRGYHLSLFFSELKDLTPDRRKEVKKEFIIKHMGDTSKHSERNLIALEFALHFKTGNMKDLVSGELNFKNNKLPSIAKIETNPMTLILGKIKLPLVEYCLSNTISEGERNNSLFKNLAIFFVNSKLGDEEIKLLVRAIVKNCPGKTENEFIGWLEKARKKEITEYNENEMYKWATKLKINPSIIRLIQSPAYEDDDKIEAETIANKGMPLHYLVETISKFHSREKDSILLLLLSGLSAGFGDRKKTIHVMAVGSSGKGKTAVMDSTSKVFSRVQRITSSSAKSQFYKSQFKLLDIISKRLKMANPNYDGVMKKYKELSDRGFKAEADKVMREISNKYGQNAQAPPNEIERGLEGILKKHKPAVATAYDYAGFAIAAMILLYLL